MTTIDKLSAMYEVNSDDQFVMFQTSNSDARKASVNTIAEYMQAAFQADINVLVSTALTAYFLNLPTTEPGAPGLPWLNGAFVCISE